MPDCVADTTSYSEAKTGKTAPLFQSCVKPLPGVGGPLPPATTPPIRMSWALLVEIPETVGFDVAPLAVPELAPFGSNGLLVLAPEIPIAVIPVTVYAPLPVAVIVHPTTEKLQPHTTIGLRG